MRARTVILTVALVLAPLGLRAAAAEIRIGVAGPTPDDVAHDHEGGPLIRGFQ